MQGALLPTYSRETAAFALAAAAASLLVLRARRRAQKAFAPMVSELDAETQRVLTRHRWLPLRHTVVHRAVDLKKLEDTFDVGTWCTSE